MRVDQSLYPSGGKAFGLLKAQQEERLNEINKVKGRPEKTEPGGWSPRAEGANPAVTFPQQQFLEDPKYSTDEDLPSKLEAFKSEGETVRVERGLVGLGVGFLQEPRGDNENAELTLL